MKLTKKTTLTILTALIVICIAAGTVLLTSQQHKRIIDTPPPPITLSKDVEQLLTKKINLLRQATQQEELIEALRKANADNASLSGEDIQVLDTQWRTAEKDSVLIRNFLTSPGSLKLTEFQEDYTGFPEIFVTDAHGLNVAQTNRTSDFYQADEQWWIDAYNNGIGRAYYGEIEFDESAQSESIPLYVPIYSTSGEVIGILKAVLDITVVQQELWNYHASL